MERYKNIAEAIAMKKNANYLGNAIEFNPNLYTNIPLES